MLQQRVIAWTLQHVFSVGGKVMLGAYRLPLYSVYLKPAELELGGQPPIRDAFVYLRIGPPNSLDLARKLVYLIDKQKYSTPLFHLRARAPEAERRGDEPNLSAWFFDPPKELDLARQQREAQKQYLESFLEQNFRKAPAPRRQPSYDFAVANREIQSLWQSPERARRSENPELRQRAQEQREEQNNELVALWYAPERRERREREDSEVSLAQPFQNSRVREGADDDGGSLAPSIARERYNFRILRIASPERAPSEAERSQPRYNTVMYPATQARAELRNATGPVLEPP